VNPRTRRLRRLRRKDQRALDMFCQHLRKNAGKPLRIVSTEPPASPSDWVTVKIEFQS
jgi:hypothetical protein